LFQPDISSLLFLHIAPFLSASAFYMLSLPSLFFLSSSFSSLLLQFFVSIPFQFVLLMPHCTHLHCPEGRNCCPVH
jgi:hypothetical protein